MPNFAYGNKISFVAQEEEEEEEEEDVILLSSVRSIFSVWTQRKPKEDNVEPAAVSLARAHCYPGISLSL